eukprot:CAMPEP_0113824044 /NCGR_PEP_ID=MMETSP0328-20130328/3046_1 /TAXON_ID=39455 /ORGANISM="Alexandrium minutum" /LENGTH=323 /DNA_ID=CAMNT_0000791985 /DNA_START=1 /DNA_END=968 /DNA_ORIENTATION=- /assembly_acc=CAM_ASM_000350
MRTATLTWGASLKLQAFLRIPVHQAAELVVAQLPDLLEKRPPQGQRAISPDGAHGPPELRGGELELRERVVDELLHQRHVILVAERKHRDQLVGSRRPAVRVPVQDLHEATHGVVGEVGEAQLPRPALGEGAAAELRAEDGAAELQHEPAHEEGARSLRRLRAKQLDLHLVVRCAQHRPVVEEGGELAGQARLRALHREADVADLHEGPGRLALALRRVRREDDELALPRLVLDPAAPRRLALLAVVLRRMWTSVVDVDEDQAREHSSLAGFFPPHFHESRAVDLYAGQHGRSLELDLQRSEVVLHNARNAREGILQLARVKA